MEATIDNQKIELHNWILAHRLNYRYLTIKITDDERVLKGSDNYRIAIDQANLDQLMEGKKRAIGNYIYILESMPGGEVDVILDYIIACNESIKQILCL